MEDFLTGIIAILFVILAWKWFHGDIKYAQNEQSPLINLDQNKCYNNQHHNHHNHHNKRYMKSHANIDNFENEIEPEVYASHSAYIDGLKTNGSGISGGVSQHIRNADDTFSEIDPRNVVGLTQSKFEKAAHMINNTKNMTPHSVRSNEHNINYTGDIHSRI